jgi:hypothetical protein
VSGDNAAADTLRGSMANTLSFSLDFGGASPSSKQTTWRLGASLRIRPEVDLTI